MVKLTVDYNAMFLYNKYILTETGPRMKTFLIVISLLSLTACNSKPKYDQELWSKTNNQCHQKYRGAYDMTMRIYLCEDLAYRAVGRPELSPIY